MSAVLWPTSAASVALRKAFENGPVLTSSVELGELTEVLLRPKFERMSRLATRQAALALYAATLELVSVDCSVFECRDPDDNKFLELALSGKVDAIVTGDKNLLCLHPWRGIAILTPADYLATAG